MKHILIAFSLVVTPVVAFAAAPFGLPEIGPGVLLAVGLIGLVFIRRRQY